MSWRFGNKKKKDEDESKDSFFQGSFGFQDMDKMIENLLKSAGSMGGQPGNSMFYGYSVKTGPDGKPQVTQFGNVNPTMGGTMDNGSREPFVDVVTNEKDLTLKVVAEMPGVQKEDIHLRLLNDSLVIEAEHGERKYNTTVPLRAEVDPSSASAAYNNGVLEVSLKLTAPPRSSGVSIKVD